MASIPQVRFLLQISYDGKRFAGFQEQPGQTTVQSSVEAALRQVTGESVRIVPSGRTDRGVHAREHPAHFDVHSAKAIRRLQSPGAHLKLNAVLPPDIAIVSLRQVSARFHARQDAKSKTYTYFILISPRKNPFLENWVWRLAQPLDIAAMQRAARAAVGKHDFSSFCASDASPGSHVKTLFNLGISTRGPAPFFTLPGEHFIRFTVEGDGFLKQMVRSLVGTLVDIGRRQLPHKSLQPIIAARDRRRAGRTAPAQGLHLVRVRY